MGGFGIGYCITQFVGAMANRKVDLVLYSDCHSLYGLTVSLAQTTERRLQIDLALVRDAYERRDITDVMWIQGNANPADDLTNTDKRCSILQQVVGTNKVIPIPQGWVQRDSKQERTSPTTRNEFEFVKPNPKRKSVECRTTYFGMLAEDDGDVGYV